MVFSNLYSDEPHHHGQTGIYLDFKGSLLRLTRACKSRSTPCKSCPRKCIAPLNYKVQCKSLRVVRGHAEPPHAAVLLSIKHHSAALPSKPQFQTDNISNISKHSVSSLFPGKGIQYFTNPLSVVSGSSHARRGLSEPPRLTCETNRAFECASHPLEAVLNQVTQELCRRVKHLVTQLALVIDAFLCKVQTIQRVSDTAH